MVRKIAVIALALFIGINFIVPKLAFAGEIKKMAFVDLARVFDQYGKTVETDKKLEEKAKAKEEERKKLVEDIRKLQDEAAVLSDDAKQKKQPAIDDKIKELREFNRVTQEDLIKERNEKVGEILTDIQKIIEDYAKNEGYDAILNSRMLLYGNEQHDITEEILKRLNQTPPKQ